jgi:hypothetical protein
MSLGIEWTCCECENKYTASTGDVDERMCDECLNHEDEFGKPIGFEPKELIKEINLGNEVICDGCNGPYDDNKMNGGVIMGSGAYCQSCADEYDYEKTADEVMDKNKTFQQNVLDFRKRMTGSSDGIMRIYTME